jgi:hypothetical protein
MHNWELIRGILERTMAFSEHWIIMPAKFSVLGRRKAKVLPHGEVG